jgi:putative salt-induced outer membrane protein YdiY
MRQQGRVALGVAIILALGATGVSPLRAQDEKPLGWAFTTELTGVWTAGNAQTTTWGVDAKVIYAWSKAEFKLEGGSVRSQSTLTTRTAVGTSQDDFTLTEETNTEKTAENYYARARYDRQFAAGFFGFAGTDWLRNTFAGIDSRLLLAAGLGNVWASTDQIRFKTDVAATYSFQEDVVENPFVKTKFPGVRAGYDLWWKLTGTTEFLSVLVGDLNLDNTDDIRFDLTNALPISISSRLALKPSHQLLWRNQPSLAEVPLVDTGGTSVGTVTVPLKKLDSVFKIALVVKF